MNNPLNKRLDRIAWALLSQLEREITAMIAELLTYPDGEAIVARCQMEVEQQQNER